MSTTAYDFVINAKDMGINVEGKNGHVEYVEKATFSMERIVQRAYLGVCSNVPWANA